MALTFRATIQTLDFEGFETRVLETYAEAVRGELETRTPGKAAKAWKISGPESSAITISNDTSYLPYIERGTGLFGPRHAWIVPKTAKVLSWMQNGRQIFATRTRGMESQPFIKEAIRAGMEVAHGNI
jgi:hypothetical protein